MIVKPIYFSKAPNHKENALQLSYLEGSNSGLKWGTFWSRRRSVKVKEPELEQ
jgi:hypothetical protein